MTSWSFSSSRSPCIAPASTSASRWPGTSSTSTSHILIIMSMVPISSSLKQFPLTLDSEALNYVKVAENLNVLALTPKIKTFRGLISSCKIVSSPKSLGISPFTKHQTKPWKTFSMSSHHTPPLSIVTWILKVLNFKWLNKNSLQNLVMF